MNLLQHVDCYMYLLIVIFHGNHINTNQIISKGNMQLYFLRKLKLAGYNTHEFKLYITCIRPLLKYAYPMWSTSLTTGQNTEIKDVQITIELLCIILDIMLYDSVQD